MLMPFRRATVVVLAASPTTIVGMATHFVPDFGTTAAVSGAEDPESGRQ